jgi:hypothetical protein
MPDFSQLTPEQVARDGKPSFAAGNIKRFLYGEGDRYIVDIRVDTDREVISTIFDRIDNKTVWPAPRRKPGGPTSVRRLAWTEGGRTAGTIRITAEDLAELLRRRDELDREGYVDLPIRVERL